MGLGWCSLTLQAKGSPPGMRARDSRGIKYTAPLPRQTKGARADLIA